MQVYDDQLDDDYVGEITTAFTDGVFSATINPSNIKQTQLFEAKNIDLDFIGDCKTRRGTAQIGSAHISNPIQGLGFFKNGTTENLLKVQAGSLYYTTGTNWTNVASVSSSLTNKVEMTQLGSEEFIVDGIGAMKVFTGGSVVSVTSLGSTNLPPNGLSYIMNAGNRIIATTGDAVGSLSSTLFVSGILAGSVYLLTDAINVGGDIGDPITGICSWSDNIWFVGKQRSTWIVDVSAGVGSNAFRHQIHKTIGLASNRSLAQATDAISGGNNIYFFSKQGIFLIQKTIDGSSQGISAPISLPINDIMKRINWDYAYKATGIYWDNKYILALPLDSATSPNYVIVYTIYNQSHSGYWTGWTPTIFSLSAFSNEVRMNFGQSNGKVMQFLDYVKDANETDTTYEDDGSPISSMAITKGFIFGQPINFKYGDQAEFEFYNSEAKVDISASIDGSDYALLEGGVNTSAVNNPVLPFILPVVLGKNGVIRSQQDISQFNEFRQIQFKLESASKKLAFRSANVNAIVTTIERRV